MKTSSLRAQLLKETNSTIWEPPAFSAVPASAAPVVIPIEREIIELLERPIDSSETHRAGHDRKECELIALLDTLTAVEALAVARRLANGRAGDALVAAFHLRLSADRRGRVVAFVTNTRRRIAVRTAALR